MNSNVIIIDSISQLSKKARGKLVICGSHGGKAAGRFMITHNPRAVVFNDAGLGKQRAGIGALFILDQKGIAGIAVSAHSARIGEGWDTFRSGIVSHVNRIARKYGIRKRMRAKNVVKLLT